MSEEGYVNTFKENSLARLDVRLTWHDGQTSHEENVVARRVNAWRDFFPPGLREDLEGKRVGETAVSQCPAGSSVPPFDQTKIKKLPVSSFNRKRVPSPCVGRFYPLGLLPSLTGVYPQTTTPFRLLHMDDRSILVDRNHPLARFPVRWEATITHLEETRGDRGGQATHWGEAVCNWGPGMQAPMEDGTTSSIAGGFFDRNDPSDDRDFYAAPRFVPHVDATASRNLQSIHARYLKPGSRVLDLMSSVHSHLPLDKGLEVTGLGLNEREMSHNPALARHMVHDLNARPELPDDMGSFQAAVCNLSMEYLTDPVTVLASVRQSLGKDGILLVGLSDRWFPTKTVSGWTDLHEFERPAFVLDLARQAGFSGDAGTISVRNDWRPREDIHYLATRGVSDPVHVIWVRP